MPSWNSFRRHPALVAICSSVDAGCGCGRASACPKNHPSGPIGSNTTSTSTIGTGTRPNRDETRLTDRSRISILIDPPDVHLNDAVWGRSGRELGQRAARLGAHPVLVVRE